MSNQVYKKVGKKYIKIGPTDGWHGFPAEGIWVVKDRPGEHSSSWITKLDEVPDISKTIEFRSRIDVITKSINEYFEEKRKNWDERKCFSYAPRNIAEKIVDDLSKDYIKNTKSQIRKLLIEKILYSNKKI